jgi:uncharacterized protein YjeT (DUF2065 family)
MPDDTRGAGPLAESDLQPESDRGEGNGDPNGWHGELVARYRRYVGEPDRPSDVYLGFGLFFAGVAMGLVGLLLFVVERVAVGADPVFWLRALSFSVGAFGLPTLLLGVVVLLPGDRRVLIAAGTGTAVCLVAVGLFLSVYPENWNRMSGTDYSTLGVSVYAAGLVTAVAASGATLVRYHIDRAAPAAGTDSDRRDGESDEAGTVSDDRVQRDIEAAMDDAELTWGGVREEESRSIRVETEEGTVDHSGFDGVPANETRSDSGVEDAVASLQGLKGGEERVDRGSGTDQQTAALQDLRDRRPESASAAGSPSLLDRIRRALGFDRS